MQFDLGSELRRVRESKKLSLRAVASAVGVSASLLSQVETGKTQPSVSTLYALVNHLGISLDALMGTKPDARFRFIQERAEFAHTEELDI